MHTYNKFGLSVLVLSLLAFIPVQTQAASTPAAAPPGSSFDQRLAQRVQEQAISLEQTDQKRLIDKCVKSQNTLRKMQFEIVPELTQRIKVYQQIDAKLFVVIGELKLAKQDTFQLEKHRLELVDRTSKFQTTSDNYTQAIDDALIINCKANPVGFISFIETIRFYNNDLRVQAGGQRDLVVNKIKTELAVHSDALVTKPATSKDVN